MKKKVLKLNKNEFAMKILLNLKKLLLPKKKKEVININIKSIASSFCLEFKKI